MYIYLETTGISMYNIFSIYLSSLVLLIYNLTQTKQKTGLLSEVSRTIVSHYAREESHKLKQITVCCAIVEIVLISLYQHGLVSIANKQFGQIIGTGSNYFGLIFAMPILLPLLCWIIGVNPYKQIDLIIPAYPLALVFLKMGCFFAGCCGGVRCSFGMYNTLTEQMEFPVQLVEAGTALLIFFFLLHYRKKAAEGMLFPMYIILYSGTRFFSEFLRKEPNIHSFLKKYQILCLVGVLFGISLRAFLRNHKDWISRIFERNLPYLLSRKKAQ